MSITSLINMLKVIHHQLECEVSQEESLCRRSSDLAVRHVASKFSDGQTFSDIGGIVEFLIGRFETGVCRVVQFDSIGDYCSLPCSLKNCMAESKVG